MVWTKNIYTPLALNCINKKALTFRYDVRGPIVNRAYQLREKLSKNPKSLPFKTVVMCNIGNPQALAQKPITYLRQILAACLCPDLIGKNALPGDVERTALKLLGPTKSIGAYTHSQGLAPVRESVAKYLTKRDDYKSDPNDIFLSNGATQVIKRAIQMIISSKSDGIMVPIPQYPLYSASIEIFGGTLVGYNLNEKHDWSVDVETLEKSLQNAKQKGIKPRAICVINPGNPAGQVLSRQNIRDLIDFSFRNNLVILADEVYQHNIYDKEKPFHSFRHTLLSMGSKYADQELMSFDSISKGLYGECGIRGGYIEMLNFSEEIKAIFLKMASANLCPNLIGQIAVLVLTNPPLKGSESYDLYTKERKEIYDSLKRRADKISTRLSMIDGISCRPIAGALYAFPSIQIPEKAVKEAKKQQMTPDEFYCFSLLEKTGICTVPGSGFEQEKGTFHLRITILPPEREFDEVMERFEKFHADFSRLYG